MVGGTGNGCFLINETTAQSIVTRRANPTRYFFFSLPSISAAAVLRPRDFARSVRLLWRQHRRRTHHFCLLLLLSAHRWEFYPDTCRVAGEQRKRSLSMRATVVQHTQRTTVRHARERERTGPPWKAAGSVCWHVASEGSIVPSPDAAFDAWSADPTLTPAPAPPRPQSCPVTSYRLCPSAVRTRLSDVYSRGVASLGSCRLPLRHVPPKRRKGRHAKYTRLCNTPLIKLEYRITQSINSSPSNAK
jgi:hypothetical protein